jgi:hypothetical protein
MPGQEIWTSLYPVSMAGEHFDSSWMRIQNEHGTGSWIKFAVITDIDAAICCFGSDIACESDTLARCSACRSSLAHDYERRPVGRMRLIRGTLVDHREHRLTHGLRTPDALVRRHLSHATRDQLHS